MKIAVTSTGTNLDSQVDPRFGRASYIVVVDTDTKEFEVIDNSSNKNASQGAGIQAAASVSNKGVEILFTGFCGPKAFQTLNAAGVKVVNDAAGTIMQVIDQCKAGNFTYADAANADGHW